MGKKATRGVSQQLKALLANEGATTDDFTAGIMRWSLDKAVNSPGEVSVTQMAALLESAAKLKAAGDGNQGLGELMAMLEEDEGE